MGLSPSFHRSPTQQSSWVEHCGFYASLINGVGQKSEEQSRLEGICSQKLQQCYAHTWFHTFDSQMQPATVPKATDAALRTVYPVPSPTSLWRAECGCRSHSVGRSCEELKRANASVFHVFPIPTSKMQYKCYELLSSEAKF